MASVEKRQAVKRHVMVQPRPTGPRCSAAKRWCGSLVMATEAHALAKHRVPRRVEYRDRHDLQHLV